MSRIPKRPPDRTAKRILEGVRVAFTYSHRKLDVSVTPDPDDLRTCPPESLLRFWASVASWARGVPQTNPGWTVQGVRPEPVPTTTEGDDHGEGEGQGEGGPATS